MQTWLDALFRKPSFLAGLAIILFYVSVALVAPIFYPGQLLTAMTLDPPMIAHCALPSPPTITFSPFSLGPHPFGQTAFLGYGVAQGLIVGSRWDLYLLAMTVIGAAAIGIGIGLVSGTFGGRTDWAMMTVTDTVLSIPDFVFVLLVVAIVVPHIQSSYGPVVFVLAMVLVMWAPYARGVRGDALRVSSSMYVESAKASGASQSRIMFRHVAPNSMNAVLAQIPITVALSLALIVAVQVVNAFANTTGGGIGPAACTYSMKIPAAPVVPVFNYPEWGGVLAAGLAYNGAWIPMPGQLLGTSWWGFLIPAVWISVFGFGVVLVSDGVRDALSPRLRK
jgi:peptide/nickel transport system permease protein